MRVLDTGTFVATPEDVILSKLEWHVAGGSERQLEDVVGILELRGSRLDFAYIERWARELGLTEPWERARRLAGRGQSAPRVACRPRSSVSEAARRCRD